MVLSDSLLNLINDILDLTRVESGRLELEFMDFDVSSMIEEALDSVSSIASGKGLEMVSSIDLSLPGLVRGDADRLKQIVVNLLSNALKFTREGEVVLRVKLLEALPKYVKVEFSVTDSGIGISTEGLKKLFNRFTQVGGLVARG